MQVVNANITSEAVLVRMVNSERLIVVSSFLTFFPELLSPAPGAPVLSHSPWTIGPGQLSSWGNYLSLDHLSLDEVLADGDTEF